MSKALTWRSTPPPAPPRRRGGESSHRPYPRIGVLMLVAGLLVLAGACSSDGTPGEIIGVIAEVRLNEQDEVEFIRLRDRDDRIWELPVEFDPGSEVPSYHLEEHRVRRLPVRVRVRESSNGLYASQIDDVIAHSAQ